ncbi:hypothetical protein CEUSTIGMA_g9258.t1 [Chlamydomonas eustigma]|uniref:mannan endo-1,4-beta-mannosidase n=1 Tax=Chlamydomonas eustigma TaxID=1157962 RepID=A0A250XGB3_9CHLO|nr:hypothetical protein CEUSTIGMA_g9258.t1 [Chlamydomonas eustigma]|eukprot:GAX81830.1 hypothetical protein CEUSTIGMA_g9258.t1 [Chlamydomonas eustigma]
MIAVSDMAFSQGLKNRLNLSVGVVMKHGRIRRIAGVQLGPMSPACVLIMLHILMTQHSTCSATQSSTITIEGIEVWTVPPDTAQGVPEELRSEGFVKRRGHQLVIMAALQSSSSSNSKAQSSLIPFYYLGFNAYWLIDKASWGQSWGRQQVVELFAAAKRLGLRVGRTWAFNSKLPSEPGVYDEGQLEALDFIIYAAGRYHVRLILALGNFWPAYFGPERWLLYGKGYTAGQDILDFYGDLPTRELYKAHISFMVNRVNKFTGLKYKDDPTIMGWDVMNEPRCPGCLDDASHDTVASWMCEMTHHLRSQDGNHLILLGSEGFFMADNSSSHLNQFNPGAGAQCEGEDWPSIGSIPDLDVSTLHVYERHMELQPVPPVGRSYLRDPDWIYCDFECYINWMVRFIQLNLEVNEREMRKPVIIEEFGLTWWRNLASDLRVVVEVVRQLLVHSSDTGGALAGAMIWSAALNDSDDQDGYNVKIDGWPSSLGDASASTPVVHYPISPPVLGSYKPFIVPFYDQPGAGSQFLAVQPDGPHRYYCRSNWSNNTTAAAATAIAVNSSYVEHSDNSDTVLSSQPATRSDVKAVSPSSHPSPPSATAIMNSDSALISMKQSFANRSEWTAMNSTLLLTASNTSDLEMEPLLSPSNSIGQLNHNDVSGSSPAALIANDAHEGGGTTSGGGYHPVVVKKVVITLSPVPMMIAGDTSQPTTRNMTTSQDDLVTSPVDMNGDEPQDVVQPETSSPDAAANQHSGVRRQFLSHHMDGAIIKHLRSRFSTRRLRWQQDQLDGFRRGWQRGDCANTASRTWRPIPINTSVVDVAAFRSFTAPLRLVDMLGNATRQLLHG